VILIISSAQDVHTQAVLAALKARGHAAVRVLDLSRFPMKMDLGMSFDTGAETQFALRLEDGERLDMGAVRAVWWRRPQPYGLPSEMTDPVSRSFAYQETDLAFRGMWQCSEALWVNDVNRDAAASHKPWQLHRARAHGLAIPRTLITNSPEDVGRFVDETGGPVVFKAFLASAAAWRETRILRPEDRAMLAAVKFAPVIFQAYVEARLDLRVTVIGERIFAAAADTAKSAYPADVRMNPQVGWRPYQLPDEVAERLLALLRSMGLQYGAVDFRVTPEGKHVFLEVNPAGQFLFVENAAGLPIAAAIAEHLAEA
jgi:glutathione synthase/RimK-type ligase-like ATP-grasp enzyme